MRSLKEIRASIKSLQERAFRDHGVELRNEAIKDFLDHMAQEKASELIEKSFSHYSLTDLMRAVGVLSEAELPKALQRKAGDLN